MIKVNTVGREDVKKAGLDFLTLASAPFMAGKKVSGIRDVGESVGGK